MRPFAFAVSIGLYIAADAFAPFGVSANNQFLRLCSTEHKRKNWKIIDSKHGAEACAMLYSLAETVKANGLKNYSYFVYLLDQLKEYPSGEVPEEVLDTLLLWSDKLPEKCQKTKSR